MNKLGSAMMPRTSVCALAAVLASTLAAGEASAGGAEPIPAALFGQNLEHTRSSITGGLSAELVRNRKFAGKPSREGLAREWEAFGCRAFYDHMLGCGVGRHLQERPMPRRNEIASQKIYAMHFLHRLMREYRELGVSCCCFFQAINEGAIRVYPRSVRLTSTGEALRLAKTHVGGVPVKDLPREVFGTDHADGSRRFTAYNPSALKPLRVRLPVGAAATVGETEILETDDPYAGLRYHRMEVPVVREGDALVLDLPPRAIGRVSAATGR